MAPEPTTLQEAVLYFSNPGNCREYVVPRRWANGVVLCPTCGSEKVTFQPKHNRWQCTNHHALRQFTLKTGTIMEESPLGLDKWLPAMWLVASNRNGVSSWELHRALGVTQKTAWFLLHRVRLAMQDEGHGGKLSGEVEIDETFIGGKARNVRKSERNRKVTGRAQADKEIVLGMVERDGTVRTIHTKGRGKPELQRHIREQVEAGSAIFTDELKSYDGLDADFKHEVINHAIEYVNGNVHTNTMENFWSLLKRSLHGTYISVEPFHLFRYLDEQAFRYNNRKPMSDADRFSYLVRKAVGKRLTYAELTGKTEQGPRAAEEPF
jgi:transposase-like protein